MRVLTRLCNITLARMTACLVVGRERGMHGLGMEGMSEEAWSGRCRVVCLEAETKGMVQ